MPPPFPDELWLAKFVSNLHEYMMGLLLHSRCMPPPAFAWLYLNVQDRMIGLAVMHSSPAPPGPGSCGPQPVPVVSPYVFPDWMVKPSNTVLEVIDVEDPSTVTT